MLFAAFLFSMCLSLSLWILFRAKLRREQRQSRQLRPIRVRVERSQNRR
jgi:hypothetical protein